MAMSASEDRTAIEDGNTALTAACWTEEPGALTAKMVGGPHQMDRVAFRLREIWTSGKYTSRDRCAEEE
ncbi:MAG: hypothetical protein LBV45_07335, partial [Xanthomonadaceae bacterium]|nr:hypothetical protein [Xanthomonadaceae bacterium]